MMEADVLLAAVDAFSYIDLWHEGEWWRAATAPWLDVVGGLFAMIAVLTLMGMFYIYSGDLAIPTVLAIVVGGTGAVIPELPASAQRGLALVMLIGISLALYQAWSVRGGGVR